MTMNNEIKPIIEEAREELVQGSIAGGVIGLGLTYLATGDRTCAGNIGAGVAAAVSVLSAKKASDVDLVRFKIAGGTTTTAAIGTAAMTFATGLLANFIFGEDAE